MNGAEAGLKLCLDCSHVCSQSTAHCPRCGAKVVIRRTNSIARSWALTLTAGILYVPANILPMMTVNQFGQGSADTILSGVMRLLDHGLLAIAALVFAASIVVPLLKLLGMMWLLLSVQRSGRTRLSLHRKMQLYRVIVWIGRWSMLDIFIISLLASLVQFGQISQVIPGAGAWAFASVVIMTMLAAISFDPRLLWDDAGAPLGAGINVPSER
ncbi:MAG: paraquat-inducible protein A [Endozoicomonas sp.]